MRTSSRHCIGHRRWRATVAPLRCPHAPPFITTDVPPGDRLQAVVLKSQSDRRRDLVPPGRSGRLLAQPPPP
jgi:hypothetical protein